MISRDISLHVCAIERTQQPALLELHHESKSLIYLAATCTTARRHPRDIPQRQEREDVLSLFRIRAATRRDLFGEIDADSQHPSIAIIRRAARLICISRDRK